MERRGSRRELSCSWGGREQEAEAGVHLNGIQQQTALHGVHRPDSLTQDVHHVHSVTTTRGGGEGDKGGSLRSRIHNTMQSWEH